jgi:hypothetical protein
MQIGTGHSRPSIIDRQNQTLRLFHAARGGDQSAVGGS